MAETPRLTLPYIEAAQAQKHVTHNEALGLLDQLVQAAVLDRDLAAPPAAPAVGDCYIPAAGATGAWSGKTGRIAYFRDGVWLFATPKPGWMVWVVDEGQPVAFNGTGWVPAFTFVTQSQGFAALGINNAADTTNRLSVRSPVALFTAEPSAGGGSGSHRLVVNKEAAANTASFLFQDGWSGRAEVGLTGDDDLHVKVSAAGSTWVEALRIAAATGVTTALQLALTNALTIGNGGTGATTAAQARGNLGLDGYVFRNRLRNPSFAVNQRALSGTIALSAGQYGHDGVKAGASGASYTVSTSGLDTTITIVSGSLILPIEAKAIEGGVYTLSHAGTAQARVWQGTGTAASGSYASAPLQTVLLAAATQTNVEFASGTILRPQFEPGAFATAFERRPPAIEMLLCRRFFQKSFPGGQAPTNGIGDPRLLGVAWSTSGLDTQALTFVPDMAAAPSVTFFASANGSWSSGSWQVYIGGAYQNGAPVAYNLSETGFLVDMTGLSSMTTGYSYPVKGHWTASAEI